MNFLDMATLATDSELRTRINVALVIAAKAIAAEGTDRSARRILAHNILDQPMAYLDRFTWAIVTNPAITAESSDSDIQYTVNSVWNSIAGDDPA